MASTEEEPSKSRRCSAMGKIFGGYTLEELGGSFWAPTGVLLTFRVLCSAGFIGVIAMAMRRKLWLAAAAPLCGLLLAAVLSVASFLHARRKSADMLPQFAGPLYQTGASVAIFMLPVFIFMHVANPETVRRFVTGANVLPSTIFLADALLLGSKVRFRMPLMIIPVLLELVAVFAPLGASGWFKSDTTSTSKKPLIVVLVIVIAWSIGSALIAVLVTRVTACCNARKEKEEFEYDDNETVVEENEEETRDGENAV